MLGKPDQTEKEDFTKRALSQLLEHAEQMHAIGAYSDQGLDYARRIAREEGVLLSSTQGKGS